MDASPQPDLAVDPPPAMPLPLRVAMVTETWPPEVNGVATTVARLAQGLREQRHALQLVRPRQRRSDGEDSWPGMHEVLLRGLPIPRYPQLRMGLPSKRRLVSLWSLQRPDVVHIATEGPLGWSALQAARVLKLPVVSDFRTNFHAYSQHYGLGWLKRPIVGYLRRFHNATHCTMVPTEAQRAALAAAGFLNLRVVARGVDTRRFHPGRRSARLRAAWGAGVHDRVIAYVGRLAPEKNLALLLQAYEAMRGVDPALKLVLVGDGPSRAGLQAACPSAIFAGVRRGEDLAAHYASADLFVFPSLTETFGNVVPEAMASGLALVAFDCAAAAQLLRHEQSALLAPPERPQDFLAAARRLAASPELGRTLAGVSLVAAQRLSWDQIVQCVLSEYRAAIDARLTSHELARTLSQPRAG